MHNPTSNLAICGFIILLLTPYFVQPVEAQTDYPSSCSDAPVVEPGLITGTMSSESDVDAFRIQVENGDQLSVRATGLNSNHLMVIWHSNGDEFVGTSTNSLLPSYFGRSSLYSTSEDVITVWGEESVSDRAQPDVMFDAYYSITAQETGHICVGIYDPSDEVDRDFYSASNFPYQWEFEFARNTEPDWWTNSREEVEEAENQYGDYRIGAEATPMPLGFPDYNPPPELNGTTETGPSPRTPTQGISGDNNPSSFGGSDTVPLATLFAYILAFTGFAVVIAFVLYLLYREYDFSGTMENP